MKLSIYANYLLAVCAFSLLLIFIAPTSAQEPYNCTEIGGVSEQGCEALAELKNVNPEQFTSWFQTNEACYWEYIYCNDNGSIDKLIFSGTSIETLPDSIGALTTLTFLLFQTNPNLVAIPETIGNLTNLEELQVTGNSSLVTIPASISNLQNLKKLTIISNQALQSSTIPTSISEQAFPNIESYTFPKAGRNTNSCEQIVEDNQGRISMIECETLFIIDKNGSQMSTGGRWFDSTDVCSWSEIGCNAQQQIQHITIGYRSELTEIPDSIAAFPYLESLIISENPLLQSIPDSIAALPILKSLIISENPLLQSIPDSIGALPILKSLSIYQNHSLSTIPASIASLTELEYLSIAENKLQFIPPEISIEAYPLITNYYSVEEISEWSINCDYEWNLLDAILIQQYDVFMITPVENCEPNSTPLSSHIYVTDCDKNDDNKCNLLDAIIIKQCDAFIENPYCS